MRRIKDSRKKIYRVGDYAIVPRVRVVKNTVITRHDRANYITRRQVKTWALMRGGRHEGYVDTLPDARETARQWTEENRAEERQTQG